MIPAFLLTLFLVSWTCFQQVHSLHLTHQNIHTNLKPSYDYIIVGGGISGLVVASRLTEDADSKNSMSSSPMYNIVRTSRILTYPNRFYQSPYCFSKLGSCKFNYYTSLGGMRSTKIMR
jgi:hypothetical protein